MPYSKVQNFKNSYLNRINPRGFTLIELLIVVAIIGVLAVVLLASYNNFGARQKVKGAASGLKADLRKYQTYALSGQKRPDPNNTDCNSLDLLYYSIDINSSGYTPSLVCGSVTSPTEVVLPTVSWPAGSTVTLNGGSCGSDVIVRFKPLNQTPDLLCGTTVASPARLGLKNGSFNYDVVVTSSGEIQ